MIAHKLGEQWAEKGADGKIHMYKSINGGCDECCHNCDGLCLHVVYGNMCPVLDTKFGVKDLGILNEDGLLPSLWGEYPEILFPDEPSGLDKRKETIFIICASLEDEYGFTQKEEYAYGKTEQEAIDNWNRRA